MRDIEVAPDGLIAVIGLGYVGLPLAVEFGKIRPVIGLNIIGGGIEVLQKGRDHTRDVDAKQLASAFHLVFISDPAKPADASIFIVAATVNRKSLSADSDPRV